MAVRDDATVAGLAEVIGQVRDELERAQRAGEGRDLKFSVERVNLEFAVQVRREGSGRAELRIGVVTAGAGGTAARDTTHTIQIELKPQGRDGDPNVRVGGE
ncbi:trypco2 family protein [Streptomyces sp. NPDC019443]|jgi:NTP-dependent ternary system trypsin peptidase co-occuring protein|uniref:trypco2 family protein n=1 Tax=Streptomyces sp. NPDC019443 TaxID=3365061 RepID=UPI0037B37F7B